MLLQGQVDSGREEYCHGGCASSGNELWVFGPVL
jgi:hypothetical protein